MLNITNFSNLNYISRCTLPTDDPFTACFGCAREIPVGIYNRPKRNVDDYSYFNDNIERQTGEMFQGTAQSRRVICGIGPNGFQRCRLRIDKAVQFRRVTYDRAIQFIQSEQYLSDEDLDIIRY